MRLNIPHRLLSHLLASVLVHTVRASNVLNMIVVKVQVLDLGPIEYSRATTMNGQDQDRAKWLSPSNNCDCDGSEIYQSIEYGR